MIPPVTRRGLLALTAGGLTALAGCQSLSAFNSHVPIQIHVLNTTDEQIQAWVQLTNDENDVGDQLGERLPMEPGMIQRIAVKVPKAAYQLRVATDNMTSSLEKTVQWRISGQDCAKNSYATFISTETGTDLRLLAENCENT